TCAGVWTWPDAGGSLRLTSSTPGSWTSSGRRCGRDGIALAVAPGWPVGARAGPARVGGLLGGRDPGPRRGPLVLPPVRALSRAPVPHRAVGPRAIAESPGIPHGVHRARPASGRGLADSADPDRGDPRPPTRPPVAGGRS